MQSVKLEHRILLAPARRFVRGWYISIRRDWIGDRVPARKLVVSTYLQYILLAVGVVLLVAFVRQIGGVLLDLPGRRRPGLRPQPPRASPRRAEDTEGHSRGRGVPGLELRRRRHAASHYRPLGRTGTDRGPQPARSRRPGRRPGQSAPERALRRPVRGPAGPGPNRATPEGERAVCGTGRERCDGRHRWGVRGLRDHLQPALDGAHLHLFAARAGEDHPRPAQHHPRDGARPEPRAFLRGRAVADQVPEGAAAPVRDHGRARVGDYVLHRRGVRPPHRGLGGDHGDHSRPRGLPRGDTGGRDRALRPRRRFRAGPARRRTVPRRPADRGQPAGAEDTGRLGGSAPPRRALRHAGRNRALRDTRGDLRRPHRRHRGRDGALPARDAALRALGEPARQARRRGA